MYPALQGFNIITWYSILATEKTAIKFMQEVGLIPTCLSPCPACSLCGSESKSQKMPSRKLGFRYVCSERKTILLEETFLTKRKYNRGRVAASMTQTVFGIFCKQDGEGLFFLVDGKKPGVCVFLSRNTSIRKLL
ncbi:hypothetical protein CDAR_371941 [Caerostris darwini]|uniref:Uncharacterized protein n=1 Tax=Caerostris darwini TaxID=1538125 RepID=A0AAV4VZS2_9ARAC|nr:hypothetical protein CDAR_371941 [Caerostris darwini]